MPRGCPAFKAPHNLAHQARRVNECELGVGKILAGRLFLTLVTSPPQTGGHTRLRI
jgi:hypothetical protein